MKAGRQVQIERKVKAILEAGGVMPALNHFYMNFGKRVDRIRATYPGPAVWDEVCIEYGRWDSRGLDKDILDKIVCNIMVSPCNPCPPCPPEYGLPWTGQTIVYAAGDDGTYQKGYTLGRPIVKGAVLPRWTIDNSLGGWGTALDNATGLMWIRNPSGDLGAPFNATINWANALAACEAVSFYGHTDWRLPNVKELLSIVDYETTVRYLDTAVFTNCQGGFYWTGTTHKGDTSKAWRVSTLDASSSAAAKTVTVLMFARPVRGGAP